jgi:hypothetical protein
VKWIEKCIYLLNVGQLTGDGSVTLALVQRLIGYHQKRIDVFSDVTQGLGHEHPFEQWKMDIELGMQGVVSRGRLK